MRIRRVRNGEGSRLRALRLEALADEPAAFGSDTLAQAREREEDEWTALADKTATSEADAVFLAEDDGRWYGIAGGFVHPDAPDTAVLGWMWVDPARRRSGIGAALVDAVVEWARTRGAGRMGLWVTETNAAARSLYVRQGFAATDRTKQLSSNPSLRQVFMVRELGKPDPRT